MFLCPKRRLLVMQSFVLVNLAKAVFVNVKIVADVFALGY